MLIDHHVRRFSCPNAAFGRQFFTKRRTDPDATQIAFTIPCSQEQTEGLIARLAMLMRLT